MNENLSSALIGTWVSDPEDTANIQQFGKYTLYFTIDGQLIQTIIGKGKMFLTWRVEDNVLIIDQPSDPREDRIPFSITPDGKLTLVYEGQESKYVRGHPSAPHRLFNG